MHFMGTNEMTTILYHWGVLSPQSLLNKKVEVSQELLVTCMDYMGKLFISIVL